MIPGTDLFGTQSDGRTVDVVRLSNDRISAAILTRGAILQDLRLAGLDRPLVLGSPDLAAYEGPMAFFGAVIAPVANRLRDATAPIDGERRSFDTDAPHNLHSGAAGAHAQLWEISDRSETAVTLTLDLPDGLSGFPGHRSLTAVYALDGAALRFAVTATTDRPTLMNVAHHAYWSLGPDLDWTGQRLEIAADRVLPVDDATVPTGEIRAVDGTGYDFRAGQVLDPETTVPLDHNFCLSDTRVASRPVMRLTATDGLSMTIETTEPGLQVFDGRPMDTSPHAGHHGKPYGPRAGLAIEPQMWPDAPNHEGFTGITLRPGETYRAESVFRFALPD